MVASRVSVVVLGGGPAGLATALSLRHTNSALSVAVVERSCYDSARIGETLPPTVQPLLQQLRVWEPFLRDRHVPAYASASAWGSDVLQHNDFIFHPHNRGWHVDRRRFDEMLSEQAVAAGVHLLTGAALVQFARTADDRWRVAVRKSNQDRLTMEADFIVDATGRRALLAHQQGAKKVPFDHLVGVVAFFKLGPVAPSAESATMIEACEDGWWYSAPLPDTQLVIAHMTDQDIVKRHGLKASERLLDALDKTRYTRSRVENTQLLGAPSLHPAASYYLDHVAGSRWLAVGDAASTFDPLSSHGIFKALRSGIWGGYAICDFLGGNDAGVAKYEALLAREFEDYLQTRWEFYGEERRWDSSAFWRRRHGRVTLNPRQVLGLREGSVVPERRTMHMGTAQLSHLASLCRIPRAAHEIVSEFKEHSGAAVSDRRIILAMQQLVEETVLELHETTQTWPGLTQGTGIGMAEAVQHQGKDWR
jgi:flavin-dependent dehydrogenase